MRKTQHAYVSTIQRQLKRSRIYEYIVNWIGQLIEENTDSIPPLIGQRLPVLVMKNPSLKIVQTIKICEIWLNSFQWFIDDTLPKVK